MKCKLTLRRTMSDDDLIDPPHDGAHNPAPSTMLFGNGKQLCSKYYEMAVHGTGEPQPEQKPPEKVCEDETAGDDGCYLMPPPMCGYCSSGTTSDEDRDRDRSMRNHGRRRCGSSDSAVGHTDEDEDASARGGGPGTTPARTLVEAQCMSEKKSQVVSDTGSAIGNDTSRRESCFTDDGEPAFRCWRTPSVVVSDYSDELVVALSLDDVELYRSANMNRDCSSPDTSSLHSTCSNVNCCPEGHTQLSRKNSDCSSVGSAFSGDEDNALPDNKISSSHRKFSGWRKIRNIVQWTPFFQTNKKQRYPWVQLAGHQGNFKAGPDQGTILKKLCDKEVRCFKLLMKDLLRPYVPEYKGLITGDEGECSYLQVQDLLGDFESPCVMDCKIGVRTYLEEELAKAKEKPKLRKDMYEKMCQIDPDAPTEEEHRLKGVTKPRYMVWRETISSTETLGFRIEGIRRGEGASSKDFKTTKSRDNVMCAFMDFTQEFPHAVPKYIQRLKAIRATLDASQFFQVHEIIGSSLLFVHDASNANVWLIDFAKTVRLPDDMQIDHKSKWKVGNHEDGYLIGLDNIISIFMSIFERQPICLTPPPLLLADVYEASNDPHHADEAYDSDVRNSSVLHDNT